MPLVGLTPDEKYAMWVTVLRSPVCTRWFKGWQIMEKEPMPPGQRFCCVKHAENNEITEVFTGSELQEVMETIEMLEGH